MLNIFGRFLDSNQKDINVYQKVVEQVNALEKKYQKLTDKQLRSKYEDFQKLYQKNNSLDEILPDVFAAVREAFARELKVRLFDVQLISAQVLHHGKISEQKTGEGKTFSAAPALYLNALTGQGVHLVTVNDYLAKRECGWVGPVYHALGATCAVIVHEQAFIYDPKHKDTSHTDKRLWNLRPVTRKEAYAADITVGTNNEFGFDYLKDNMVFALADQSQRGHHFAIVDEVDSILIDEARTPLIISRPAAEPTEKYYQFAQLIEKLDSNSDYLIDEKQRQAHLTESGTMTIEKLLGVENIYEKDFSTLHHIEQALKARTLFQKNKDYVVKDNEVIIVDEFTGRLMPGRRYSEGLHQAIEAKEGVKIQQESQTLATISFQNYFRMYEKLAGMTGTAATEAEEFHKIYKLEVVIIPTHRPMVRQDHADVIYKTIAAKYTAVADEIEQVHQAGQPVLIGTTSIEKNELLSELLKRRKISHALLNAKNHEKEAEIIEKAGEKGAVTVATNMAGRGVDIKLGKDVDKLGGLYVIGTERHESRRIDNQLRGRAGRQGDPGASRFFVSLEDDLMRIFGGEQVSKVMSFLKIPEDTPIEHGMVSKAIQSAQVKVEGHNFDIRKTTVEYDDVMNQQRKIIYGVRKQALEAAGDKSGLREDLQNKISEEIATLVEVHSQEGVDAQQIAVEFADIINLHPNQVEGLERQIGQITDQAEISTVLTQLAKEAYEDREKQFGVDFIRSAEVFVYLNTIDTLWIEHLDTMDDLRAGIGLRGYAQRDPLIEYKREAFDLFEKLVKTVDHEIVHRIYKLAPNGTAPTPSPIEAEQLAPVMEIGVAQEAQEIAAEEKGQPLSKVLRQEEVATKVTIERDGQVVSEQNYGASGAVQHPKIGRNDPCYCGSGKKYKRCHFPN